MRSDNQLGTGIWVWIAVSAMIAIAYCVAGIFLIITRNSGLFLSPDMQLFLSIALILYGIFRIYRVYTKYNSLTDNKKRL
jgi:hypothetical protein